MINLIKVNKGILNKFANLLLLFSPILQTYGFPGSNLVFILSIVLIVLWFISGKKIDFTLLPKYLNWYFIYYFISFFIALSYLFPSTISQIIPLGMIRTYLTYTILFAAFDYNYFISKYRILTIICITFFFIQEISYYSTGVRISGLATFLPLSIDNVDNSMTFIQTVMARDRSSSFFSEPAHFAQFLFPILIVELFKKRKSITNWLFCGSVVLTLLLLQSGNAIFGLFAIIVTFTANTLKISKNRIKNVIAFSLIIFTILIGINYYGNTDKGRALQERKETISTKRIEASSAYIRIYRGWYVFDKLDFHQKILGADNKEIILNAEKASVASSTFGKNDFYFNAAQDILIRTGIIGLTLFAFLFFILYKEGNIKARTLILTLTILFFISSLYMSMIMATYIIIAYKERRNTREKHINSNNISHIIDL